MRACLNKIGQKLGLVTPPALIKAELALKNMLVNKLNVRLDSIMMVDIPKHMLPRIPEIMLGTNRNFVTAVMQILKKEPRMCEQVLAKLENFFDLAEAWDHSPRKLIPLLYILMTDYRFGMLSRKPDELIATLDHFSWWMDEFRQKDDAKGFDFEVGMIIRKGIEDK